MIIYSNKNYDDKYTFLGLLAFLFINLTAVKHALLDFPINGDDLNGDGNGVIKRDENIDIDDDDNDNDDDDDDDNDDDNLG